jgi:hypothetical protein
MRDTVDRDDRWPEIDVGTWAETKRRLHLYAQMLGKLRVALSPPEPNWMHTRLLFTPCGITTGAMPLAHGTIDATLDVLTSEIVVRTSGGERRAVALASAPTVAAVYGALNEELAALGLRGAISPIPQELADTTPFDRDTRTGVYDPAAVQRWFRVATAVAGVFDRWRSPFFGRSGVQLWWGALDVSVGLFNGRHATPPADRGYIMRYDLDAELLSAGFYLGDEASSPFFYAYVYPQPAGDPPAVRPAEAAWSDQLREWVLPYDAVRTAEHPADVLCAFLDDAYEHCFTWAAWDRAACSYDAPPRSAPRP